MKKIYKPIIRYKVISANGLERWFLSKKQAEEFIWKTQDHCMNQDEPFCPKLWIETESLLG